MKCFSIAVLAALLSSSAASAQSPPRICADPHGQAPPAAYTPIAAKLGAEIVRLAAPVTAGSLERCRVLLMQLPSQEIKADEREAIVGFVNAGGSLLVALDEERRAPLEPTRINDLIAEFDIKLTADTEYLHNTGAIAKQGPINAADRELPFSGGRAVEGGTPFAWQLDRDGKARQAFAAFAAPCGKVVVLGDAMATLLLGTPDGVRLTGVPRDPSQTRYWGKDSAIFMEELLTWLAGPPGFPAFTRTAVPTTVPPCSVLIAE
jgi:hypothetical protein